MGMGGEAGSQHWDKHTACSQVRPQPSSTKPSSQILSSCARNTSAWGPPSHQDLEWGEARQRKARGWPLNFPSWVPLQPAPSAQLSSLPP